MSSTPDIIQQLVDRFENDAEHYRGDAYNETLTRVDFINPMFKALGWDMDNTQGYADAYRDVIHEDAIKIGGETKAPDYCFRIGGTRKFFLEAKKPGVNIRKDPAPAFQLRRYAWSAKLPLSILTDFEEFAVYDCRVKPHKFDKPSTARVFYCTYDQYVEKWPEIAGIFARESILKGSFDKYAETTRKKRGTAEVDEAFLSQIETFRDLLARNIALRNRLSQRELNFAVQRTIDRIIFLRICEDRGIEVYANLRGLLNGPKIYRRLCELYNRADERYNSGLFHFHKEKDRHEAPDELTPSLDIDDKVLKEIISSLYYPDSPYEFSVLGADILGQVYEQFLGKVIYLTPGGRARIEEKPEVRKAGGVYYTPTYIVDYIVANTVGKLVEGKTPREVAKIRVLDPACGSGSFLIGAYQFLLDWHLQWYLANDPAAHARGRNPAVYEGRTGWRLTTALRKRILLNNIYGVDIDNQAVEVTKLSLLLKVLEGETGEGVNSQLRLFHERALPDLGDNIKCGNSLIGPDFYDNERMLMLDEEEKLRINVFDWNKEFAPIMKAGGFDAVIGNPPYVRQEAIKASKDYFSTRYSAFDSTADLYVYFIERAVRLLRSDGCMSFIVSSSFLRANFGKPLRTYLGGHASLVELVDFGGLPVFSAAKDTYVCIPLIHRANRTDPVQVINVTSLDSPDLQNRMRSSQHSVNRERFSPQKWASDRQELTDLFLKISSRSISLGSHVANRLYLGVKTGLNEAFEIAEEQRQNVLEHCPRACELIRPFLGGQDIRRYAIRNSGRYLIAIPCGWTRQQMQQDGRGDMRNSEREAWAWLIGNYTPIAQHLHRFAEAAKKRQDKGEFWWELRPCDYYEVLDGPKIIYPDIAKHPRFYLDSGAMYIRNTAYCLGVADPYLLGLLNSQLCWFCIARISIPFGTRGGEYRYRLFTQYIEQIPIRQIDPLNKHDVAKHDRMVALVDQMLKLHERLAALKPGHEREALQRQIDATDGQIDRLVYELYGLTDEEIRLVEEATAGG